MQYHTRLRRNPFLFRKLTGITPEKFDALVRELEQRFDERRKKRLTKKKRQRKIGAGRKYQHSLADRVLMLLIWYRTYETYGFIGFLFSCDAATICRNVREVEPLLAGIFRIPETEVAMERDEVMAAFFDGTEQQINRPKRKQKEWYSGKKKRHTVKHLLVVVRKRKHGPQKRRLRIAAVARASPGKAHDKTLFDEAAIRLPAGVSGSGDLGFLGTTLIIPIKKPKGKELTRRQKAHNRNHSRKRICVEHGIGKMKIWNILSHRFRSSLSRHTLIFKNVAGFHNLMFA